MGVIGARFNPFQESILSLQGFGLLEVLVSAAWVSVVSLGMLSLNELGMKSAN